jgi:hypothetical protein
MRELSLQAASPFIVRVLMRAMREFSTYRFCLHWITFLCTFAVMDSRPLVGCGGYARERDEKSLTYYQKNALRTIVLMRFACCNVYRHGIVARSALLTYHDNCTNLGCLTIDQKYCVFLPSLSARKERKKEVIEGKLEKRLESCLQHLSPQQRNEKHCRSLTACMDMLNPETARARYIFSQSLHVLFCLVLGDVGLISRMSRPCGLELH